MHHYVQQSADLTIGNRMMKKTISNSESILVAILILLVLATSYILLRLYDTSSLLSKSNRMSFLLEAKNKRSILEKYFTQLTTHAVSLSHNKVFEAYYAAKSNSAVPKEALRVLSNRIEQELLTQRLGIEDRGLPVYSRIAYFDFDAGKILARTDYSPKGTWINDSFFEKLRGTASRGMSFEPACFEDNCRLIIVSTIKYHGNSRGLLLMELSIESIRNKIQLLDLQRSDDFAGLVDKDGSFVLGPKALLVKNIRDSFGVHPHSLQDTEATTIVKTKNSAQEQSLLVAGGPILDTGLHLILVAPSSKFASKHSPTLWVVVFVFLLGSLIIVMLHISRTYAQRQEMYLQLQQAHDTLEVRVRERTADLEELNKKLRVEVSERTKAEQEAWKAGEELASANQELKDFAYVVSHDLKAPLRAVANLAGWLVQDYSEKLDEDGKNLIDLMKGRVNRMHGLIDGILRYSRLGRIREEKKELDLNTVLHEVVDIVSPPPHIKIVIQDHLPVVKCEPTRMLEVFQNLLDNAVKYMDKSEGNITVSCTINNGDWLFSVADNGPGIDERHYEKVFQIFQTLTPKDERESTGIGLTLVKKTIELHGGNIWVESQSGHGTTFLFTLPKDGSTNAEE